MDCKTHTQALLSKWVLKALIDPTMEWAKLFFELSSDFTWEQRRVLNRAQYTQDQIILASIHTYRSMPYTAGIQKAWEALRWHLILIPKGNVILAHWQVEDLLNHLQPYANMEKVTLKNITIVLGKLGIMRESHLQNDVTDMWASFETKLDHMIRGIYAELKALVILVLESLQEAKSVTLDKVADPDLWAQVNETPTNGRFMLRNRQTYPLLLIESKEWMNLNECWGRQDTKKHGKTPRKRCGPLTSQEEPIYFYGESL